jgi:hypothetical protein
LSGGGVSDRKNDRPKQDFWRTVHYYAFLIGVIACLNFWLYWIQGSKLTLALAFFCLVCLVGWLVAARLVLR